MHSSSTQGHHQAAAAAAAGQQQRRFMFTRKMRLCADRDAKGVDGCLLAEDLGRPEETYQIPVAKTPVTPGSSEPKDAVILQLKCRGIPYFDTKSKKSFMCNKYTL